MSSQLASLTNVVPDVVRAALDFIIDSAIRAHSANTENTDKLPPVSTPLSTATTAPKILPDNSIPISTFVTGNGATLVKSRRRLDIPAPESENERVPMSEELGKKLFSQGYDSDGFILDFDIDSDMHLLDDYNSKEISPSLEGTGMCDLNVLSDYDLFTFLIYLFVYLSAAAGVTIAAEPQFLLISDDDIKKLKVDQLHQELKARGLGIHGLKNELKDRLRKSMVIKIPM